MQGMPGMNMPSKPPAAQLSKTPAKKDQPQDMQSMPGMNMPSNAPAKNNQPQDMQNMPGMNMPPNPAATEPSNAPAGKDQPQNMQGMPGMNMPSSPSDKGGMAAMDMGGQMMMGATGSYSMMRDASGTSWQPDTTPMEGLDGELDGWSTMLHGYIMGIYDHQGGPRGDDKVFSASMLMGMAQKQVGVGTLTLRTMLSLDPLMGKSGYPLLLQTGETANGVTPLVDRQHPHDLFMELAGIYSVPLSDTSSVFGYVGYPGEPALGPPAFMHRFSGMDDPAAPITHHWLDSTHITYGVLTGGFVDGDWKIEGSAFRGREPDQFRWNFDPFKLDSASTRLSWNPTPDWALQASYGFLKSPEQLEPTVNQHRTTASASYNMKLDQRDWQTTLAWGRNNNHPGNTLDAFLLESAISWNQHTIFARAENAAKDELFRAPSPLAGKTFKVSSFSLGYIYDIPVADHLFLGLGAMGTVDVVPSAIEPSYGSNPMSYMLFTRLKIK
jgi:hypothetical protein